MSFKESVLLPLSEYKKLLSFTQQQNNYSHILHDKDKPVNVRMMLYDQEQYFKPIKAKRTYTKNENRFYEYVSTLPQYFVDLGVKLFDFLNEKMNKNLMTIRESKNGLVVNDYALPIDFKRLLKVLFSLKNISNEDELVFIKIFFKILLKLGYDSKDIPASEWINYVQTNHVDDNSRIPSYFSMTNNKDITAKPIHKSSPIEKIEKSTRNKNNKANDNLPKIDEQNEMFFDAFSNTPERIVKQNISNIPISHNKQSTSKDSDNGKELDHVSSGSEDDTDYEEDEKAIELERIKTKHKRLNPRFPRYPSTFETRNQKKKTEQIGSGIKRKQNISWMLY